MTQPKQSEIIQTVLEKPKTGRGGPRPGSGRPKGVISPARQRQIAAEANLRQLAGQHTAKAVKTLVDLIHSKDTPPAAKVAAVRELLDRAHGKAAQSVEIRQNRDASEYSDADLYAIAGLGGSRVAAPSGSSEKPH